MTGDNIKLILFDLDGVLIDAKHIHYETLNRALGSQYAISEAEHLSTYDGLKTDKKLELLTKSKGLPVTLHKEIWKNKQKYTLEAFETIQKNDELVFLFDKLKKEEYMIGCCSNSIRRTVLTVLAKLGIIQYFDIILSNEDVVNSKPHPEIYWTAMSKLNFLPEQTLIVEDSPPGLLAAHRSKAMVMRVASTKDLTEGNLREYLVKKHGSNNKWSDKSLNVLIPMAGAGSRFEKAGFTFPKPLIEVNGKPMIQVVVDNLNVDANFIFIVQKSHKEKYNLGTFLNTIAPGCKIVEVEGLTEGAACTTLLAEQFINNQQPLLIANSDQYLEWDSNEFFYKMNETKSDAGIVTFTATHPKWSFAKVDEHNNVLEVAEKNPISDIATAGIYYWKHGSDYVRYANQMIHKNIRVNNEFYVCPAFNEAISDSKKINTFHIEKMWGIGTPEDLEVFLKHHA